MLEIIQVVRVMLFVLVIYICYILWKSEDAQPFGKPLAVAISVLQLLVVLV